MNNVRNEVRIIPLAGWIGAVLAYLGFLLLATRVLIPGHELSSAPIVAKLMFSVVLPLVLALYVLLVAYVYADARRRGMRYVLWTLIALFVPNAIGIILYFILREPLPRPCPNCGRATATRFPYCPGCGTALAPTCPECKRPVEPEWSHCPHCGANLRYAQSSS